MADVPNEGPIDLPGKTKAAVLLACLGADTAGRVMAAMSDEEVDELTLRLASLDARSCILGICRSPPITNPMARSEKRGSAKRIQRLVVA